MKIRRPLPSAGPSVVKGLLNVLLVFSLLLFATSPLRGMNASPEPVTVTQPDGSKVTLRVRGSAFSNWYEDAAGFTVVRDAAKRYVYANRDANGDLGPTALVAGKADPAAAGLTRKLKPAASPAAHGPRARGVQGAPPVAAPAPPAGVQPQGTVKNLVILCRFADHPVATHTRPQADFQTLFNTAGGDPVIAPTGSVRDYFNEASYGTLNLQSTVVAWVTLPQNEAYYANGEDGTGLSYPNNAQGMVRDALNLADALVNFGNFDADNDGFVDCISIIHSGYAAETGGGNGNWIWSHRWSLWALPGGLWTSADPNGNNVSVKVSDYHTEPALWGTSGTDIVRIGVICHETGHFFGLPDLYDTDDSSYGIGSWCLMANSWGFDGSQLHPPHPSAWCKEQLGWVTPTVSSAGIHSLPRAATTPAALKITAGFPAGEYLLIENRQPFGYDNQIPQGGLAVWHIDMNKPDNEDEGYPDQGDWPENGSHYRIALLQADGLYDLEAGNNGGDGGDLYHAGGTSAITPATLPSTNSYQGGNVVSTNNSITHISAAGNTMTLYLNTAAGIPVITSSPTAAGTPGEAFSFQVVASEIPTAYGAAGLPDGLSINTSTGLISGTPTAAAVSTVTLSATNSFGTGTSTLTIHIVGVITLEEAVDTSGLVWTNAGSGVWTGQNEITHDGIDAARSGDLGDDEMTWIETTVEGEGTLTFWWKVSSEEDYDLLHFTLDGEELASVPAISGAVGWTQVAVGISTPGSHTLRWSYAKDGSVSEGDDCAWVDQVSFSTGPQAPLITSVTTTSGVLNQAFNYQITATGNPESFSATGLPQGLSVNTTTGLISGTPTETGTSTITLGATNSHGTGNATLTLIVTEAPLSLGEAVDALSLTWTTGGSSDWESQTTVTSDGEDAATSGAIDDDQTSWIETTVEGEGTLSFRWQVSSEEGYDFLHFTVDGEGVAGADAISGQVGWVEVTVPITGEGSHTLRWTYEKDGSLDEGTDTAWLDRVSFAGVQPGPEISIELDGLPLLDGASASFQTSSHGASEVRTIILSNPGDSELSGLLATIDGPGASAFSIYPPLPASLPAGGSTTVYLAFSPQSPGDYTAALHIASNDADEASFDINLSGSYQNLRTFHSWDEEGIVIPESGVANPYPSVIPVSGIAGTVTTLRVKLTGLNHSYASDVDIFLMSPSGQVCSLISDAGSYNEAFALDLTFDDTAAEPASITELVSGTFLPVNYDEEGDVDFLPPGAETAGTSLMALAAGNPNGDWKLFVSDDVDGDAGWIDGWSIEFESSGPEIEVEALPDGVLANGVSTLHFLAGSSSSGITVSNRGSSPLTGLAATIDGPQGAAFSVSPALPAILAPGASFTFQLSFTPQGTGNHIAALHIASNDADEASFDINLSGTPGESHTFSAAGGISVPDFGPASPYPSVIPVSGINSTVLALRVKLAGLSHTYASDLDIFLMSPSGQVCSLISDAGSFYEASFLDLTFDDTASGPASETTLVSGTFRPVNYDQEDDEDLIPEGAGTIGTSLMALVGSNPNGDWKLFVSDDIGGDDGEINTWSIEIISAVQRPEIELHAAPVGKLVSGESTLSVSSGSGREITIRNLGNAPLTGLSATIDGLQASAFSIAPPLPGSLAAGASMTFEVSFAPQEPGSHAADLHIASSDADEASFDVNLSGTLATFHGFSGTSSFSIPYSGPAFPYPSVIPVSGVSGTVTALRVNLRGLSHSFPSDLDVFLMSPDGRICSLISDAGSSDGVTFINLTFDDTAANAASFNTLVSGTFLPVNHEEDGDQDLIPVGTVAIDTGLLDLITGNPNGNWKLFVSDDTGGDIGSISSWSIEIESEGPGSLTPLEQWRLTHFGVTANSGNAADDADPDNDGRSNLIEFATSGNPLIAGPVVETAFVTGIILEESNLEFTYTRSKAAVLQGLEFTVEWTNDFAPGSWTSSQVTETVISEDATTQTVKAVMPAGEFKGRFARLRVE